MATSQPENTKDMDAQAVANEAQENAAVANEAQGNAAALSEPAPAAATGGQASSSSEPARQEQSSAEAAAGPSSAVEHEEHDPAPLQPPIHPVRTSPNQTTQLEFRPHMEMASHSCSLLRCPAGKRLR